MCDLRAGSFEATMKDPIHEATHSPALPWFLRHELYNLGISEASFTSNTSINVISNIEMSPQNYETFSHFLSIPTQRQYTM